KLSRVVVPSTSSRREVLVVKPSAETVTSYVPGGNCEIRNVPSSPDFVSRVRLVSIFLAVRGMPGIMAPCSSVIFPVILAAVEPDCPKAKGDRLRIENRVARRLDLKTPLLRHIASSLSWLNFRVVAQVASGRLYHHFLSVTNNCCWIHRTFIWHGPLLFW